jgi:hypothetical protein
MNFSTATGWSSSNNALTANAASAFSTATPIFTPSLILDGATLPSGTIDGFEIEITFSGATFTVSQCKLRKNGSTIGTSQSASEGPGTYVTIGNSSNKFGTTWVDTDTLGCDLIFRDNSAIPNGAINVSVEHVRVEVFYTPSGPQTYDEAMLGGALGGSAADVSGPITETMTGGSLGGGSCDVGAIFSEIILGGAVVNGQFTGATFAETAVGGCTCGGAGGIASTFSETGSSGAVAGGQFTGATFNEVATGGSLVGGLGLIDGSTTETMSGGSLGGGACEVFRTFSDIAVGGAVVGGEATGATWDEIASGGILAAGDPDIGILYFVPPSGGAVCGGIAYTGLFDYTMIGGAKVGGNTPYPNGFHYRAKITVQPRGETLFSFPLRVAIGIVPDDPTSVLFTDLADNLLAHKLIEQEADRINAVVEVDLDATNPTQIFMYFGD